MANVNTSFGACLRKVRHETRETAEDAARKVERADRRRRRRPDIAVYRCFVCDGWHIGRPSKRGGGAT